MELPQQLGNGTAFNAEWTAWVCEGYLLAHTRNNYLFAFQPGSEDFFICQHDSLASQQQPPAQLLAPSKTALLWPCSSQAQACICLLGLPSLTELHQFHAPPALSGASPFRPFWIGWRPQGDLFAVAWRQLKSTRQSWLHLHVYSASEGRVVGNVSLAWGSQRAQIGRDILFWWMAEGDCIAAVCGTRLGHRGYCCEAGLTWRPCSSGIYDRLRVQGGMQLARWQLPQFVWASSTTGLGNPPSQEWPRCYF